MSEWWTYRLSSFLLFSPRTYYRLFELYNRDLWPAHLLAVALGLAVAALWRPHVWCGRAVAAILAACWLTVAWAYLYQRYDTINWAAKYFALAFVLEALLLIASGVVRNRLILRGLNDAFGRLGLAIFIFALGVQPLIGPLAGRNWVQAELFGLAPDPTVVATLGVLTAGNRPHWNLQVIPLVWCAISGATLWTMQSPDALVMPLAALAALSLAIAKGFWRSDQIRKLDKGATDRP